MVVVVVVLLLLLRETAASLRPCSETARLSFTIHTPVSLSECACFPQVLLLQKNAKRYAQNFKKRLFGLWASMINTIRYHRGREYKDHFVLMLVFKTYANGNAKSTKKKI